MDIDTERTEFYAAIGLAITQWEFVETVLCEIFSRMLVSTNGFAANAAYYSIINANARRTMIDAAAEKHLPHKSPIARDWAKLSDKVRKLSGRRNAFAHFSVVVGDFGKGRHFRLQPTVHNSNEFGNEQAPYFVNDINASAIAFSELAEALEAFLPKIPVPQ